MKPILLEPAPTAAKHALAPGMTYAQEVEYAQLSPFEITRILKQMAVNGQLSEAGEEGTILNVGRGNPNFLNTIVRKAYAKLSLFAAELAEQVTPHPTLGFRPDVEGIHAALLQALAEDPAQEVAVLRRAIDFAIEKFQLDPDQFAFELVDAALGDFYPEPPRIFPLTEVIVNAYLADVLNLPQELRGQFDLFATEGATEAMLYSFKSLRENRLLHPGDQVATITPIFAPYLEIPASEDYELVNIRIAESEELGWQIPASELAKLEDEAIKVLYLVNPSNPTSVGLSRDTIDQIAELVRTRRRDLIILDDTVYATFVDDFYSFVDAIPENTLCVYSYSKYFGVTGWRLGVIMLHPDNVIDRLIQNLPVEEKAELNQRYGIITTEPERLKFIDRLELDSRDVALAHTGGLSGPQQAIMCLFSLFNLMDNQKVYRKSIERTLDTRIQNLYRAFPADYRYTEGPDQTHYYALLSITELAGVTYGEEFAKYLTSTYQNLDFLLKLAAEEGIICLPGTGFDGPAWTLRVSLANLRDEDYLVIGEAIMDVLGAYYVQYQEEKARE